MAVSRTGAPSSAVVSAGHVDFNPAVEQAAHSGPGVTSVHLTFPGPNQQGVFNVTQLLLAGIGADRHEDEDNPSSDYLYGYRQLIFPVPQSEEEYPGLWLLTLTNYGFLPVDWFKATEDYDQKWFDPHSISKCNTHPGAAQSKTPPPSPQSFEQQFSLDKPSRGWYIAALGMSLTIVVACLLLLSNPSFVTDTWSPVLLGAGLSLSAAQWILLVPAWQVLWQTDNSTTNKAAARFANHMTLIVVVSSMILPLLARLGVNVRRQRANLHNRWRNTYVVANAPRASLSRSRQSNLGRAVHCRRRFL